MPRHRIITVPLPEAVAADLFALAERDLRGPREQAALLIREAIHARSAREARAVRRRSAADADRAAR